MVLFDLKKKRTRIASRFQTNIRIYIVEIIASIRSVTPMRYWWTDLVGKQKIVSFFFKSNVASWRENEKK